MFEQTLLPNSRGARKRYSLVLSLLLQIFILGLMCLAPFVFTTGLPIMQLKNVLAAPRPPRAIVKAKLVPNRPASPSSRTLRVIDLSLRPLRPSANKQTPLLEGPSVDTGAQFGDANGLPDGLAIPIPLSVPEPAPPPKAAPIKKPAPRSITVGGVVASANLIQLVHPDYPQLARINRIQGVVEFTATISKEGFIENLTLVRGHPFLVKAAREAVLQWRYRPTLLNGEPVEVVTDIVVNFTLNQ